MKTKIVCVSLYANTFFALLATEDTCSAGVANTATFIESFFGKCVGNIRKARMNVLSLTTEMLQLNKKIVQ